MSSGGTTGTQASGGIASSIAEPLPYTLLSLNRYARIMQVNPAHFNGLVSSTIFPLENRCSDLWFRYDWQANDSVSWESLAQQIKIAEDDVKAYCRYSPAPDWEAQDVRPWPAGHRHDMYTFGWDVRDEAIGVPTSYDYLISPGRRAVTLIDDAVTITYSDPDGDGYNERATITASTSVTNVNEIKIYVAGRSGAREWEIRPVRSKSLSSGTVTFIVDAWVLVNPDKRALPPTTNGPEGLDLFTASNYLSTVDVYREYTDTTVASAEMFWASNCGYCQGNGCANCTLTSSTGCARITSMNPGMMQPYPATYSSDDGIWSSAFWPAASDPKMVSLWYLAGFMDNEYLAGRSYDPLSQSFAQVIAWMATARLERPFCNCGTASALAAKLQNDMAITDGDTSKNLSFDDLENPFGTRLGEIWAWRRLKKIQGKRLGGYAV